MKILKFATSIIFIIIILFCSCRKIPTSVGKARDVVIVAANIDTSLINANLQIYQYVPQREPNFIFIFAQDTLLKNVQHFHSIFLYGSLKNDFIYELLDKEARAATLKDTFNLFKVDNLWAREQTVVILAVAEPSRIPEAITRYKQMITKIFEESYYHKVKASFYEKEMDNKVKIHLRRFGWELDMPVGWIIDSTYKNENFIFVHTHYPDRSIFLYKEKNIQKLDDSLVIEKRNNLTKKYYSGDYVFKELTTVEPIEFQDMKGLRVRGVWQNDSLVAGGPFLSYFLLRSGTLYVIDGILFLPGERKTDYMMGLEVMMNSFKIIE